MIPSRAGLIGAIAGVLVVIVGVYGIYHAGESNCTGKQAVAQIKLEKKVKAHDAKIAKSVPITGDAATIDKFLLDNAGK